MKIFQGQREVELKNFVSLILNDPNTVTALYPSLPSPYKVPIMSEREKKI